MSDCCQWGCQDNWSSLLIELKICPILKTIVSIICVHFFVNSRHNLIANPITYFIQLMSHWLDMATKPEKCRLPHGRLGVPSQTKSNQWLLNSLLSMVFGINSIRQRHILIWPYTLLGHEQQTKSWVILIYTWIAFEQVIFCLVMDNIVCEKTIFCKYKFSTHPDMTLDVARM